MASHPDENDANRACFFYGTLMSVQILCRVIGRDSGHLEFADALLEDYTRHHVKGVDYPAIVPAADGTNIIGRTLSKEEASVRGTVVKGLTAADIRFLDTFEGDEYERISVEPFLLSPWRIASDSRQSESLSSNERTSALVYVWIAPLARLEPDLWSFADFLRDKAHRWIGNGVDEAEYLEVDRRRQMEGKIVHASSPDTESTVPLPAFGHAMRDACFSFKPEYTNLNHGGVGALPREVAAVRRKHQDRAEEAPDKHFRKDYIAELKDVKKRCGQYLHCDGEDLAFVLNATTGCNIVLRSLRWQNGDRILFFPNAVYGSCQKTILFVRDHREGVELVPVAFTFPCSHAFILSRTRIVIEETLASLQPGQTIRLGLLDAICSKPGVVMPWAELCSLYKEYGILSLVDAAHLMGQMPVNLTKADPDFWVSNTHKWCFAPRSLAVLYVPKRNHHLVETFPTSFGYVSSRTPKTVNTPSSFSADFSYTGTQDVAGILSLPSAFDFREACGGESRIIEHNHSLVVEGAKFLADKLGTEVMQDDTCELIASMANVRLPLDHIPLEEQSKVALKLDFILLDDYDIAAAAHAYGGRIWIRVAAQIYNEMGDFHKLGAALEEILRDGKLANV